MDHTDGGGIAAPDSEASSVIATLPWWIRWRIPRRARRLAEASGSAVFAAGRYVIRSPVDHYHRRRFAGEARLLSALARRGLPAAVPRVVYHRSAPAVMVYRSIDGLVSAHPLVPPVAAPPASLVADCARRPGGRGRCWSTTISTGAISSSAAAPAGSPA